MKACCLTEVTSFPLHGISSQHYQGKCVLQTNYQGITQAYLICIHIFMDFYEP